MFKTLDIESDFWSDPELRVLFKEEHLAKVPSRSMWAIALLVHPLSKFKDVDYEERKSIIVSDYLGDSSFTFDEQLIEKFKSRILTIPQRIISTWDKKLQEIQLLLDTIPVNVETYEVVAKMMKDLGPMMKQYKEVYKTFLEEQELATHGGVEESLSEKTVI